MYLTFLTLFCTPRIQPATAITLLLYKVLFVLQNLLDGDCQQVCVDVQIMFLFPSVRIIITSACLHVCGLGIVVPLIGFS